MLPHLMLSQEGKLQRAQTLTLRWLQKISKLTWDRRALGHLPHCRNSDSFFSGCDSKLTPLLALLWASRLGQATCIPWVTASLIYRLMPNTYPERPPERQRYTATGPDGCSYLCLSKSWSLQKITAGLSLLWDASRVPAWQATATQKREPRLST